MKKYCSYMKFDNLLENPSKTEKCPILASRKMLHIFWEQTPILESMMCTVHCEKFICYAAELFQLINTCRS